MVNRIGVLVCLLALTATGRANGAPPPQFNIIVEIQNYAMVDKWTLRTAKSETGRVFAQMGIQIEWQEGPQAIGPVGVPVFSVVMLSTSMAAEKTRRDSIPTITLATSSKSTGRAYVFYSRLSAVAAERELDEGLMLGHALMHELGHMIANIGHDTVGIMRKFLELKEAGFFGFTSAQKVAIQAALRGAMATPVPMIALRAAPDMAR
jgi:hypothetical protein